MSVNWSKIIIVISLFFILFVIVTSCMEEFSHQTDPKLDEIKNKIAPLFSGNIKYSGILETINKRDVLNEISMYIGEKSYTINKEKVFLCLKDKQGEYYDMNILIFVTLHELSHVLSETVGHDENFNIIFDAILKKAEEMQIYDSKIPMIHNYCE